MGKLASQPEPTSSSRDSCLCFWHCLATSIEMRHEESVPHQTKLALRIDPSSTIWNPMGGHRADAGTLSSDYGGVRLKRARPRFGVDTVEIECLADEDYGEPLIRSY